VGVALSLPMYSITVEGLATVSPTRQITNSLPDYPYYSALLQPNAVLLFIDCSSTHAWVYAGWIMVCFTLWEGLCFGAGYAIVRVRNTHVPHI